MIEKRKEYIDVAKGIGIILVIAGHCGLWKGITAFIYFFHMPLFFLLSGLVGNDNVPFGLYCKKKLKSLIYPYFTLGSIAIVYNTIIEHIRGINGGSTMLYKRIIALVYGNYIWESNGKYIGTLWFMPAMFCTALICYGIKKIDRLKYRFIIIGFCYMLAVSSVYIYTTYNIRLPWCLDIAFLASIIYMSGVVLKNRSWQRYRNKKNVYQGLLFEESYRTSFLFLASGTFLSILNTAYIWWQGDPKPRLDMLTMKYGFAVLFILGSIFISIGIIMLVKIMCEWREYKLLSHIGRVSILIMFLHLYIKDLMYIVIDNSLLVFIFTAVSSVLLSFAIEKYVPWIYIFPKNQRPQHYSGY